MTGLTVWMYGKQIGKLSRQRGVLSFQYTAEALELGAIRPLLSVSMPTRSRPYGGSVPHSFFDGLLPEGEARRMIEYDFGVAEADVLGLLEMIGRDCAGALVIIPEGEAPGEEGAPELITDAQVIERIRNLRIAPLGVDQKVRVSLAGMQGKLLLARLDDGWGLPVDGAPSTHIIKPTHPFLPETIANEAFCMRIAYHLGIECARAGVGEFEGLRALVIERYDRSRNDEGHVTRLHQEDFCQAHALNSSRKYEEGGGPSLRSCAEVLDRWSPGSDQLERLLDISVLNVLVGNADAHAKNLSLLHSRDGQVKLAPAYDVISTIWYENVSVTPGMLVNDVEDIRNVTGGDLASEAASWGMPQEKADDRVEQLLTGAEEAVMRAAKDIKPPSDLMDMLRARTQTLAP